MTITTILGANGKLGAILASYARRVGLNWRTQTRKGAADVVWSGAFDDSATDQIFQCGSTLINMIGTTAGTQSELRDTNVRFVQDLLRKAAQNGVAHVVLASTAAVYGARSGHFSREDDPLRPLTPYGISKVAMERAANTFTKTAGPSITILRIGNVAGADALTAAAKHHIAEGTPMPLHQLSDGKTPTRSYIGPIDLCHAIRALNAPFDGSLRVVNVAHPQPVTLSAMLAAYSTHILPDLRWTITPAPEGTPTAVTLSTHKMRHFLSMHKFNNPAAAFAAQVAEHRAA